MKVFVKAMSLFGLSITLLMVVANILDWPIPLGIVITIVMFSLIITNLGFAFWTFSFSEARRKKIAKRGLITSLTFVVIGTFGVYQHFSLARVILIIGIFIFCFFYGTLLFKSKYEKWKIYTRSKRDALFLTLFDYVGIISLLLGLLFKFQNWRGGYVMTLLGLVVLAVGIFAWNQKFKKEIVFRKETEDKLKLSFDQIERQHQKLEEKQKEITDSINYAKRIQDSLLANDELLQKNLNDHFILFKPKDIVSGDFYWAVEKDNRFYLAVCDSTGHGVPGAFMSLLNITFLNEAIIEKNIAETNEILNHVRKRLIENISQQGGQDGMDAVLICVDKIHNTISYTAAHNNPLLIQKNEIISLQGDKMPVGKGELSTSFIKHTLDFTKGDMLYLLTDGYADQFGGQKGKKFMAKNIKELFLSISQKPMNEQKEIVEKQFNDWKGNREQVDDVCVIGIRI